MRIQVFEEKHKHKALQEKRGKSSHGRWKISPELRFLILVTGKRGGEEGERGGVGEEEVVGLVARPKSFLHRAAPEIFGQAVQLVHEKIVEIVKFGSNLRLKLKLSSSLINRHTNIHFQKRHF